MLFKLDGQQLDCGFDIFVLIVLLFDVHLPIIDFAILAFPNLLDERIIMVLLTRIYGIF